jgi:hypothetical protein
MLAQHNTRLTKQRSDEATRGMLVVPMGCLHGTRAVRRLTRGPARLPQYPFLFIQKISNLFEFETVKMVSCCSKIFKQNMEL